MVPVRYKSAIHAAQKVADVIPIGLRQWQSAASVLCARIEFTAVFSIPSRPAQKSTRPVLAERRNSLGDYFDATLPAPS